MRNANILGCFILLTYRFYFSTSPPPNPLFKIKKKAIELTQTALLWNSSSQRGPGFIIVSEGARGAGSLLKQSLPWCSSSHDSLRGIHSITHPLQSNILLRSPSALTVYRHTCYCLSSSYLNSLNSVKNVFLLELLCGVSWDPKFVLRNIWTAPKGYNAI